MDALVSGSSLRVADDREAGALWPAVKAAHVFEDRAEYDAFREGGPWRILSGGSGVAAVVERWRDHLDILAIRGLWARQQDVSEVVRGVMRVADEQGFGRVLSPLVTEQASIGYRDAGCVTSQTIVVLRARARDLEVIAGRRDPPLGVEVGLWRPDDIPRLAQLDAECFDSFWRYESDKIAKRLKGGRVGVARSGEGLIGYTHATIHRGAGTIGRLAVAPGHRRRGVGAALLADVVEYCVRSGASEVSLCTQEENVASRTLYASAGLPEMPGRLLFLVGDSETVRT
jgi:ribosomal-protein-alanine N-acetyltransferase